MRKAAVNDTENDYKEQGNNAPKKGARLRSSYAKRTAMGSKAGETTLNVSSTAPQKQAAPPQPDEAQRVKRK